jgi:hypothetical protein
MLRGGKALGLLPDSKHCSTHQDEVGVEDGIRCMIAMTCRSHRQILLKRRVPDLSLLHREESKVTVGVVVPGVKILVVYRQK